MSDKVNRGDPLRIRASTFNTMVDAAKQWKNGQTSVGGLMMR